MHGTVRYSTVKARFTVNTPITPYPYPIPHYPHHTHYPITRVPHHRTRHPAWLHVYTLAQCPAVQMCSPGYIPKVVING